FAEVEGDGDVRGERGTAFELERGELDHMSETWLGDGRQRGVDVPAGHGLDAHLGEGEREPRGDRAFAGSACHAQVAPRDGAPYPLDLADDLDAGATQ